MAGTSLKKKFVCMALPNIVFMVALFSFISNSSLSEVFGTNIVVILLSLLAGVVLLPLTMGLVGIYAVIDLFRIPGGSSGLMGEYAYINTETGISLWFICAAFVWSVYCASQFQLGTFQEDMSYVSGHHYEVEKKWDDSYTIKKVDEYSGDSHFLENAYLYSFRFVVILCFGMIPFLWLLYKNMKIARGKNVYSYCMPIYFSFWQQYLWQVLYGDL